MKSNEEILQGAMEAAQNLKKTGDELMEMYEALAKQEDLELVLVDEDFREVEFRMDLTSETVLLLMEARNRYGGVTSTIPLSEVIRRNATGLLYGDTE